jgi:hypothetical protein
MNGAVNSIDKILSLQIYNSLAQNLSCIKIPSQNKILI